MKDGNVIAGAKEGYAIIKIPFVDEIRLIGDKITQKKTLFGGIKEVKTEETIVLNKNTIKSIIKEYKVLSEGEAASSTLARGAVGALLLGPVGLLAGVAAGGMGKKVEILWHDGTKSLTEMTENVYEILMKLMY